MLRHDDGLHYSTSIVKQLLARDDVDVGFFLSETPLLITCTYSSNEPDEEIANLLLDKVVTLH